MQKYRLAFLLAMLLIVPACGISGDEDPARQATLDAISNQVYATGTAGAQGIDAASMAETAQAALGIDPAAQTATAAAFAPILAELPQYGVQPTEGKLGWVHPPVSLDASGYHQF